MDEREVVVVGAGLAGLVAARDVAAGGRSVVVLEARERVGGRTVGHTLGNGSVVEMGGQWVGPLHTQLLALIDALGLETFPTYDDGDGLTVVDGTVTRTGDEPFGAPDRSLPEIRRLQADLESLAATVSLASPWATPQARALDRQTLEGWLTTNTRDDVALRFYRFLTATLFSVEPWELSLLHFLFCVRSGGMFSAMTSTTSGAQELRVAGGSQRISERLAEELGAGALRYGARVHTVRQDHNAATVGYDGGSVAARQVIVALPPTLAGRLHYEPPLPARRDGLTQRVPMGCVIKLQVAYSAPFWRGEGLSGQVVSLDDPLSVTFDNSPHDGSCGVLAGFVEGDHARQMAAKPARRRRAQVLDCLARYFGPAAAEPGEYVELDWSAEEFTRGCYGGRLAAGVWTGYGKALAEPVGRIKWAGTETAGQFNDYMEGAVRSGQRAARAALASAS